MDRWPPLYENRPTPPHILEQSMLKIVIRLESCPDEIE